MTGTLSLTELQLLIRDTIYLSLPDFYWVVAEISELKLNYSGHCYLELIEKQPGETSVKARIRAVIWSNRYSFIKSFFESSTGESIREGFKVLVKVKIEYHQLYGLSLVITDIDPAYTIGEMAAKRQAIIRRLEEEGVFGMNKELDLPLVPQRIAIISSRNAAGYADFINQLTGNSYRYAFHTALFDTVMQGIETEQSVISALDRIASNLHLFDLVVIIRGGGSQTDLSWFDNYNIAYHVTQFPLPVITGIGHDKDLSVTDMVACRSLKTPTAVADFIIDHVSETENHLLEISIEIKEMSLEILEEYKNRIDKTKNTIAPLSRILITELGKTLAEKAVFILNTGKEKTFKAGIILANRESRLVSSARTSLAGRKNLIEASGIRMISGISGLIKREEQKLTGFSDTLSILNPANVMKRGYTITSLNGRIVRSAYEITEGILIKTDFSDGSITSLVTGKDDNE
jgi:exodeoxyribonuclease VII large subunit